MFAHESPSDDVLHKILGLSNVRAAARAKRAGLAVVMDACIGVEHSVLRVPPKSGPPR